ncbi:glycosyltransferase [Nonlabens tegetincola]|uniref:glycosyltransferase n=1 Tax=Nonlabens tegetincola TaxID=323273 RepID=UPI0030C7C102
MIVLILVVVLGYFFIITSLSLEAHSYRPERHFNHKKLKLNPPTGFSVLICYRNEAGNLLKLLNALVDLNKDRLDVEFIFINDESTDHSESIINKFSSRLNMINLNRVKQSASGKKDCIEQGIAKSKFSHIVTIDADCTPHKNWLQSYKQFYDSYPEAHFVSGPVEIKSKNKLNEQLQRLEMKALQLTGIGAYGWKKPFLANGANMSFTKEVFYQVNGYAGNNHISSGDDIFLLEKCCEVDSARCYFIKDKDALVFTEPVQTLHNTINQRARWAQKGTHTSSMLNKLVAVQVLFMSVLFILAPFLLWMQLISIELFLTIYFLKLIADYISNFIYDHHFKGHKEWKWLLPVYFTYPFLVLLITYKSLFKITWRGRSLNTQPQ